MRVCGAAGVRGVHGHASLRPNHVQTASFSVLCGVADAFYVAESRPNGVGLVLRECEIRMASPFLRADEVRSRLVWTRLGQFAIGPASLV
ncbi:hypothetical protein DDD63_02670 [Actinobaculum sp. 313]|nr:hypothetical protein DDD63_02670 [Actinobaculum sp. 313]